MNPELKPRMESLYKQQVVLAEIHGTGADPATTFVDTFIMNTLLGAGKTHTWIPPPRRLARPKSFKACRYIKSSLLLQQLLQRKIAFCSRSRVRRQARFGHK